MLSFAHSILKPPVLENSVVLWMIKVSVLSPVFQAAAKMNQFGMYMPSVLSNLPAGAGAVQLESQAAGLKNPEQQTAGRAAGTPVDGVPPSQGLACSGSQPNANSFPAGLEKAAPHVATVQAPAPSRLKPSPRHSR